MKVCEDVAIGPYDKTGAFTLDRTQPTRISPRIIFIGRPLKEQVVQRRAFADFVLLGDLNNNNARRDGLEHFRECYIQLVNHVLPRLRSSGRDARSWDGLWLRRKRCTECNAQGQNG